MEISMDLNVAVEGCCHGELDTIYRTISQAEATSGRKVDLLLICGDFESVRDAEDLESMAVPPKYRHMNTFHDYVTGVKIAPVLTIFIGGNHEASNVLQSLYFGGFVAPNIYFLGFAGVVWYGGIRISGVSGIYNHHHYRLGHFESVPYTEDTKRSVYHTRELEMYRLGMLSSPVDVVLSHDWPKDIWKYGDERQLLRRKPFLQKDMNDGTLGSPPLMDLMKALKPSYWFAAHHHVKYPAIVPHITDASVCAPSSSQATKFLALDKVLPGRDFLSILTIPRQKADELELRYDYEWLAILKRTHELLITRRAIVHCPVMQSAIQPEEIAWVKRRLETINGGDTIPMVDKQSLPAVDRSREGNEQTDRILHILELPHRWTYPAATSVIATIPMADSNEIDIDSL